MKLWVVDECHPESKATSNGLCFKLLPLAPPLALSLIDYNLHTKISPSFHKLLLTVVFSTATKRQDKLGEQATEPIVHPCFLLC